MEAGLWPVVQIHFQPLDEWSKDALKYKVAVVCIYQVLWEIPVAWLCCDTEVDKDGKCAHGLPKEDHCAACDAVIREALDSIRSIHHTDRRRQYDEMCPQQ